MDSSISKGSLPDEEVFSSSLGCQHNKNNGNAKKKEYIEIAVNKALAGMLELDRFSSSSVGTRNYLESETGDQEECDSMIFGENRDSGISVSALSKYAAYRIQSDIDHQYGYVAATADEIRLGHEISVNDCDSFVRKDFIDNNETFMIDSDVLGSGDVSTEEVLDDLENQEQIEHFSISSLDDTIKLNYGTSCFNDSRNDSVEELQSPDKYASVQNFEEDYRTLVKPVTNSLKNSDGKRVETTSPIAELFNSDVLQKKNSDALKSYYESFVPNLADDDKNDSLDVVQETSFSSSENNSLNEDMPEEMPKLENQNDVVVSYSEDDRPPPELFPENIVVNQQVIGVVHPFNHENNINIDNQACNISGISILSNKRKPLSLPTEVITRNRLRSHYLDSVRNSPRSMIKKTESFHNVILKNDGLKTKATPTILNGLVDKADYINNDKRQGISSGNHYRIAHSGIKNMSNEFRSVNEFPIDGLPDAAHIHSINKVPEKLEFSYSKFNHDEACVQIGDKSHNTQSEFIPNGLPMVSHDTRNTVCGDQGIIKNNKSNTFDLTVHDIKINKVEVNNKKKCLKGNSPKTRSTLPSMPILLSSTTREETETPITKCNKGATSKKNEHKNFSRNPIPSSSTLPRVRLYQRLSVEEFSLPLKSNKKTVPKHEKNLKHDKLLLSGKPIKDNTILSLKQDMPHVRAKAIGLKKYEHTSEIDSNTGTTYFPVGKNELNEKMTECTVKDEINKNQLNNVIVKDIHSPDLISSSLETLTIETKETDSSYKTFDNILTDLDQAQTNSLDESVHSLDPFIKDIHPTPDILEVLPGADILDGGIADKEIIIGSAVSILKSDMLEEGQESTLEDGTLSTFLKFFDKDLNSKNVESQQNESIDNLGEFSNKNDLSFTIPETKFEGDKVTFERPKNLNCINEEESSSEKNKLFDSIEVCSKAKSKEFGSLISISDAVNNDKIKSHVLDSFVTVMNKPQVFPFTIPEQKEYDDSKNNLLSDIEKIDQILDKELPNSVHDEIISDKFSTNISLPSLSSSNRKENQDLNVTQTTDIVIEKKLQEVSLYEKSKSSEDCGSVSSEVTVGLRDNLICKIDLLKPEGSRGHPEQNEMYEKRSIEQKNVKGSDGKTIDATMSDKKQKSDTSNQEDKDDVSLEDISDGDFEIDEDLEDSKLPSRNNFTPGRNAPTTSEKTFYKIGTNAANSSGNQKVSRQSEVNKFPSNKYLKDSSSFNMSSSAYNNNNPYRRKDVTQSSISSHHRKRTRASKKHQGFSSSKPHKKNNVLSSPQNGEQGPNSISANKHGSCKQFDANFSTVNKMPASSDKINIFSNERVPPPKMDGNDLPCRRHKNFIINPENNISKRMQEDKASFSNKKSEDKCLSKLKKSDVRNNLPDISFPSSKTNIVKKNRNEDNLSVVDRISTDEIEFSPRANKECVNVIRKHLVKAPQHNIRNEKKARLEDKIQKLKSEMNASKEYVDKWHIVENKIDLCMFKSDESAKPENSDSMTSCCSKIETEIIHDNLDAQLEIELSSGISLSDESTGTGSLTNDVNPVCNEKVLSSEKNNYIPYTVSNIVSKGDVHDSSPMTIQENHRICETKGESNISSVPVSKNSESASLIINSLTSSELIANEIYKSDSELNGIDVDSIKLKEHCKSPVLIEMKNEESNICITTNENKVTVDKQSLIINQQIDNNELVTENQKESFVTEAIKACMNPPCIGNVSADDEKGSEKADNPCLHNIPTDDENGSNVVEKADYPPLIENVPTDDENDSNVTVKADNPPCIENVPTDGENSFNISVKADNPPCIENVSVKTGNPPENVPTDDENGSNVSVKGGNPPYKENLPSDGEYSTYINEKADCLPFIEPVTNNDENVTVKALSNIVTTDDDNGANVTVKADYPSCLESVPTDGENGCNVFVNRDNPQCIKKVPNDGENGCSVTVELDNPLYIENVSPEGEKGTDKPPCKENVLTDDENVMIIADHPPCIQNFLTEKEIVSREAISKLSSISPSIENVPTDHENGSNVNEKADYATSIDNIPTDGENGSNISVKPDNTPCIGNVSADDEKGTEKADNLTCTENVPTDDENGSNVNETADYSPSIENVPTYGGNGSNISVKADNAPCKGNVSAEDENLSEKADNPTCTENVRTDDENGSNVNEKADYPPSIENVPTDGENGFNISVKADNPPCKGNVSADDENLSEKADNPTCTENVRTDDENGSNVNEKADYSPSIDNIPTDGENGSNISVKPDNTPCIGNVSADDENLSEKADNPTCTENVPTDDENGSNVNEKADYPPSIENVPTDVENGTNISVKADNPPCKGNVPNDVENGTNISVKADNPPCKGNVAADDENLSEKTDNPTCTDNVPTDDENGSNVNEKADYPPSIENVPTDGENGSNISVKADNPPCKGNVSADDENLSEKADNPTCTENVPTDDENGSNVNEIADYPPSIENVPTDGENGSNISVKADTPPCVQNFLTDDVNVTEKTDNQSFTENVPTDDENGSNVNEKADYPPSIENVPTDGENGSNISVKADNPPCKGNVSADDENLSEKADNPTCTENVLTDDENGSNISVKADNPAIIGSVSADDEKGTEKDGNQPYIENVPTDDKIVSNVIVKADNPPCVENVPTDNEKGTEKDGNQPYIENVLTNNENGSNVSMKADNPPSVENVSTYDDSVTENADNPTCTENVSTYIENDSDVTVTADDPQCIENLSTYDSVTETADNPTCTENVSTDNENGSNVTVTADNPQSIEKISCGDASVSEKTDKSPCSENDGEIAAEKTFSKKLLSLEGVITNIFNDNNCVVLLNTNDNDPGLICKTPFVSEHEEIQNSDSKISMNDQSKTCNETDQLANITEAVSEITNKPRSEMVEEMKNGTPQKCIHFEKDNLKNDNGTDTQVNNNAENFIQEFTKYIDLNNRFQTDSNGREEETQSLSKMKQNSTISNNDQSGVEVKESGNSRESNDQENKIDKIEETVSVNLKPDVNNLKQKIFPSAHCSGIDKSKPFPVTTNSIFSNNIEVELNEHSEISTRSSKNNRDYFRVDVRHESEVGKHNSDFVVCNDEQEALLETTNSDPSENQSIISNETNDIDKIIDSRVSSKSEAVDIFIVHPFSGSTELKDFHLDDINTSNKNLQLGHDINKLGSGTKTVESVSEILNCSGSDSLERITHEVEELTKAASTSSCNEQENVVSKNKGLSCSKNCSNLAFNETDVQLKPENIEELSVNLEHRSLIPGSNNLSSDPENYIGPNTSQTGESQLTGVSVTNVSSQLQAAFEVIPMHLKLSCLQKSFSSPCSTIKNKKQSFIPNDSILSNSIEETPQHLGSCKSDLDQLSEEILESKVTDSVGLSSQSNLTSPVYTKPDSRTVKNLKKSKSVQIENLSSDQTNNSDDKQEESECNVIANYFQSTILVEKTCSKTPLLKKSDMKKRIFDEHGNNDRTDFSINSEKIQGVFSKNETMHVVKEDNNIFSSRDLNSETVNNKSKLEDELNKGDLIITEANGENLEKIRDHDPRSRDAEITDEGLETNFVNSVLSKATKEEPTKKGVLKKELKIVLERLDLSNYSFDVKSDHKRDRKLLGNDQSVKRSSHQSSDKGEPPSKILLLHSPKVGKEDVEVNKSELLTTRTSLNIESKSKSLKKMGHHDSISREVEITDNSVETNCVNSIFSKATKEPSKKGVLKKELKIVLERLDLSNYFSDVKPDHKKDRKILGNSKSVKRTSHRSSDEEESPRKILLLHSSKLDDDARFVNKNKKIQGRTNLRSKSTMLRKGNAEVNAGENIYPTSKRRRRKSQSPLSITDDQSNNKEHSSKNQLERTSRHLNKRTKRDNCTSIIESNSNFNDPSLLSGKNDESSKVNSLSETLSIHERTISSSISAALSNGKRPHESETKNHYNNGFCNSNKPKAVNYLTIKKPIFDQESSSFQLPPEERQITAEGPVASCSSIPGGVLKVKKEILYDVVWKRLSQVEGAHEHEDDSDDDFMGFEDELPCGCSLENNTSSRSCVDNCFVRRIKVKLCYLNRTIKLSSEHPSSRRNERFRTFRRLRQELSEDQNHPRNDISVDSHQEANVGAKPFRDSGTKGICYMSLGVRSLKNKEESFNLIQDCFTIDSELVTSKNLKVKKKRRMRILKPKLATVAETDKNHGEDSESSS